MQVLKVVAEGDITSFRYPHFMQQVHPTFEMPPPATIYGLIASVLGQWFDPQGVSFAYNFTCEAEITDLEHIHVLRRSSGKLKGTQWPKTLEGSINPFQRHLLFRPKLTLYINQPDWITEFQSPRYVVTLGRSQDLMMFTSVSVISLEQAEQAYFQSTLLPYEFSRKTARGYAVLMPRYLDYHNNRYPYFQRYNLLKDRVRSDEFLHFGSADLSKYWIDPTADTYRNLQRGLCFHDFVD